MNSKTIDVHAHAIPKESLERMRRDFPDWGPTFSERGGQGYIDYPDGRRDAAAPPGAYDAAVRVAEMDAQRVDLQVMSVPPYMFNYEKPTEVATGFAAVLNDGMMEMAASFPDRLHMLATLPLQDAEMSVREITRIAGTGAVRGVEIGTNVDGANLDDPSLAPVWVALEEANLPVLVHSARGEGSRLRSYHLTNLVGNPLETSIAIASLIFGGVIERHPDLRFCFVHGGGFAPYQIGRWDHGWACRPEAQVNITSAPSSYFQTMYVDALTHDELALSFLGDRVGWDRVMLGTDYPFDMAEVDPVGRIDALGLSDDDRERVFHRTAEAFLRPLPDAP